MIGGRLFAKHLMTDVCQIGIESESGTGPEPTVTYTYGSDVPCYFIHESEKPNQRETIETTQVDVSQTECLVPLGTSVNAEDRFRITKVKRGNYQETLSTPLVFAIIADPKEGMGFLTLRGTRVQGGSVK